MVKTDIAQGKTCSEVQKSLPRLRGTFVIFACITLVSESGLSVTVAFRKTIPNSTSLMFPMMLPLAREGPPVQGREGKEEHACENCCLVF